MAIALHRTATIYDFKWGIFLITTITIIIQTSAGND